MSFATHGKYEYAGGNREVENIPFETSDAGIVAETNRKLSQLVEINRALCQDLDVSRRQIAKLGRERDDLLRQVEILRIETRAAEAAKMHAEHAEDQIVRLAAELDAVARERDEAVSRLSQSTAAMQEIRYALANRLHGTGLSF